MNLPNTKKTEVIDDYSGIAVSDPYRWLEDSNDQLVKKWIQDQNEYSDNCLRGDPTFKILSLELQKNFKDRNIFPPYPVNGTYFYEERGPEDDQLILYMKKGLDGTPIVLVDPNQMDKSKTTSISSWSVSGLGEYITYSLDKKGSEMSTIYVMNVASHTVHDVIPNSRFSVVRWLSDSSGFFYTRNPQPGDVPGSELHMHTKVYFHRLGDSWESDELIFGTGRPKDDMINLSLSQDGRYLGINVSQKWTENEIYLYEVVSKKTTLLVTKIPSTFTLSFLRDKVLIFTNYKADKYRVLSSSYEGMFRQIDDWQEFVPECDSVLDSLRVTEDRILLSYLVNACSEVVMLDYDGKNLGKIKLPPLSSITGISCRRDEKEFFYGVQSFTFPKIVYRFDPKTQKFELYDKTLNPINPEEYVAVQEWYESKDGAKIPIFIVHKKSIKNDGLNPTVLYGYGGFGHVEMPGFLKGWISWLQRGGIFAIPNIRGGGEFGKKWHEQGIKQYKQNSYDDFIAAAEHLIKRKYTSPDKLGIMGGSNGGLLVAAVSVQKPELFNSSCAAVPLTDMVRFSQFGVASRWIHEYGNPAIREDLKLILEWSPYHNVEDRKYPNFLITTAENDARVHPLHARKFTAQLQTSNKNTFLFTETDAGHGSGKPIWKIVESQALKVSFFSKFLGLSM